MKYLKHSLYILALLLFSACSDFLDLAPEHANNVSTFYQTPGDFNLALMSVYSQAQNFINNSQWLEVLSDNSEITFQSAGISDLEIDQVEVSSDNTHLGGMWQPSYFGIAYTNTILNRIDDVAFGDPARKDQYRGEAHFMRAWNYFNLVRIFGEIPISTQEITGPEQEYDRSLRPVSEIYDLIISDLQEARALLPVSYGNTRGRATQGAAVALLGKVFLTQGRFNEAASELATVINGVTDGTYDYGLVEDYASLFSQSNGNLKESLFEIEFISGVGEGNRIGGHALPAPEGSGRSAPPQELVELYLPEDIRGPATAIEDGSAPYAAFVFNMFSKYFDPGIVDYNDGSANFLVIRYSDVLLMYAEALNEIGYGDALAFDALNQVRTRAGLASLTEAELPDQQAFRLAVELERRLEFANERQRWFDLVRTGRVQEVMNAHFINIGDMTSTVDADDLTLPIPQRELDLMGVGG